MFAKMFPEVIEGIYIIMNGLLSWKGELILNLLMAFCISAVCASVLAVFVMMPIQLVRWSICRSSLLAYKGFCRMFWQTRYAELTGVKERPMCPWIDYMLAWPICVVCLIPWAYHLMAHASGSSIMLF